MVVHMIRLYCEPPKGEAETAVNNWVTNYNEWEGDPADSTLMETNTETDGTGVAYLYGNYRFIMSGEDPTNIITDLSTRLENVQGGLWNRVGYHVCDHDESDRNGCSWDEKTEYGTIPTEIPDIEVSQ